MPTWILHFQGMTKPECAQNAAYGLTLANS